MPGGCAIGARPVELHVRGLQALGAEVHIDHGTVHAYVKGPNRRLKGAKIYLDYPSVGATETLMMAATLAEGETVIENAAEEPEVADLANFCRAMGAKIQGAGTNTIVISGVPKLHAVDYSIIPDRIEAGTFLVAGAITHFGNQFVAGNSRPPDRSHCQIADNWGENYCRIPRHFADSSGQNSLGHRHRNSALPRFPHRYASSVYGFADAERRRQLDQRNRV